ncbi:MAG: twin-arginine translocation signal domain-containing protein [Jannaschia sp.]
MSRRSFLKGGALAAASATLAAPAMAQSQPAVQWRLQSALPRSLDTLYGASERLAQQVSEATDGQFQLQPFAAGEIVGTLQVADAVTEGTVECGHTFSSYYVGKDPAFVFGTVLPFGLNPRQTRAWVVHGGGEALLNAFYAKYNIYSIPSGNTGVQMGGWFSKDIDTVADLEGLRFRIVGVGAEIMSRLGVIPQNIPAGDIYPSLERGTIDAVEFIGPHDDERLGLAEVARNYYFPSWWDPGTAFSLFVNLDRWNELPSQYQSILKQCCTEVGDWMQAKYDALNPPALRRIVASGATLKPFSREIIEASAAAAEETFADLSASHPEFATIFEPYRAFQREQLLWWQVAEYPYDTMMQQLRSSI